MTNTTKLRHKILEPAFGPALLVIVAAATRVRTTAFASLPENVRSDMLPEIPKILSREVSNKIKQRCFARCGV